MDQRYISLPSVFNWSKFEPSVFLFPPNCPPFFS